MKSPIACLIGVLFSNVTLAAMPAPVLDPKSVAHETSTTYDTSVGEVPIHIDYYEVENTIECEAWVSCGQDSPMSKPELTWWMDDTCKRLKQGKTFEVGFGIDANSPMYQCSGRIESETVVDGAKMVKPSSPLKGPALACSEAQYSELILALALDRRLEKTLIESPWYFNIYLADNTRGALTNEEFLDPSKQNPAIRANLKKSGECTVTPAAQIVKDVLRKLEKYRPSTRESSPRVDGLDRHDKNVISDATSFSAGARAIETSTDVR